MFSGLHNSPNGTQPGSNASYGFTWLNGVATSTSVTDYDAETTKLTVADGTKISADGSPFTVAPGSAASLAFTSQPPNWAAKNTPFTAAVTAYDTWGNTVPNHGPVSISLGINPNGGHAHMRAASNCQAGQRTPRGVASVQPQPGQGHRRLPASHAEGSPGVNSNKFKRRGPRIRELWSGCSVTRKVMTGWAPPLTNTSVSNFTGQAAVAVDGSLQANLNLCGGSPVQVGPGTVFEAH